MKGFVGAVCVGLVLAGNVFAADTDVTLETEEQKLSYTLGVDLGQSIKNIDEKLDLEMLYQGMLDAYNDVEPLLSEEEALAVQQAFAQRQQQKQIQKVVEMIKTNSEAEAAFLKENKTREGVVETESGLQYKIVKKGAGKKPTATDTVKVHYKGTLLDGTEFDSSYQRGEPVVFQVDGIIPGWKEALPLMEAGSIYELYIPAKLAYGDRGAPPVIEPGSMLVFQVELLDIVEGDEPEAQEGDELDKVEGGN